MPIIDSSRYTAQKNLHYGDRIVNAMARATKRTRSNRPSASRSPRWDTGIFEEVTDA